MNTLRKIIILVMFFHITSQFTASAQKKRGRQYRIGTEVGMTGSFGLASLSNKNISLDNNVSSTYSSFEKHYGGRFSISRIAKKPFSSLISIYGEYLFNDFKKNYNITLNSPLVDSYNKEQSYQLVDYIFAFRYIYLFGNYFEKPIYFDVGVSLSNLKTITENNSIENDLFYSNNSNNLFQNNYNQNIKSIILGVGMYKRFLI